MPLYAHFIQTCRLAFPVMLNRAGMVLMLFIDISIAGHVGVQEQARFGAALIPVVVLQVIAVGLLIGVIVQIASNDGAGRRLECGQVWRNGLAISTIVGLVYALVLSIGAPILANVLNQPPSLAEAGGPVLIILGWGMPGLLLFAACAHAMEGLRRPVEPLLVTIGANVVNAGLAYTFAFGALGVPGMGATGVAAATTITRTLMGIAGVIVVLRSSGAEQHDMTLSFRKPFAGLGRLLRLGVPLALAIGLETMCFSTIINMGSWISDTAIAVMSAAINYTSLLYMLTTGLATAASVRVANALSAGDWRNAARAGWMATGIVGAVMTAFAIATAIYAEAIAGVYTVEKSAAAILAPLLAQGISFLLVTDGLQGVLMGALRGCADTFWPTLIYAVSFWMLGVPIAYYWGYLQGGGPIWLVGALTIALAAAMVALSVRFLNLTQRAKIY